MFFRTREGPAQTQREKALTLTPASFCNTPSPTGLPSGHVAPASTSLPPPQLPQTGHDSKQRYQVKQQSPRETSTDDEPRKSTRWVSEPPHLVFPVFLPSSHRTNTENPRQTLNPSAGGSYLSLVWVWTLGRSKIAQGSRSTSEPTRKPSCGDFDFIVCKQTGEISI